jgi:acyl-coenzyme A synthetase/AMP-(fatty) acid ligase
VTAASAGAESVWGAFARAAAEGAERDYLHVPLDACRAYSGEAITLRYGQAHERVSAVAAALADAGYGAAHRVAIALDNRPEFFEYFLALNSLGASIVPLNAAMSGKELNFVLEHSDAGLVVTHADHAAHVRSSLPSAVPLHIARTGPDANASGETLPPPRKAAAAEHDEAALLYTSGTTGKPKGCVLTNGYFLEAGRFYTSLGGYCRFTSADDRLATPLPVTHMNALAVSFMAMLETRGCLIQLDRFHPSTWWQSLRASRATAFHYLGVMPAMLLKAPPAHGETLQGRLRFGFGAGVDPRHHAAFEARFGVPLIEAWAMTETGAGAWITANEEPRHVGERCFGRAPRGLAYRVVDDAGIDVAAGAAGELLVRREGTDPRRGFFSGYYKDARATDEAWAGGWFHTGDLVRVGADGAFYFVDRSKNVVRRSGENIAAVEVESALGTHPDVAGSAVCPVGDEMRGEEVFAFVVLRPGAAPTLETASALQRHCLEALAYYKAPGYVAFRAELPQTASQKLARGEIKTLAARALEAVALAVGAPRAEVSPAETSRAVASPAVAPPVAEPVGPPAAMTGVFDLRHLKRRRG